MTIKVETYYHPKKWNEHKAFSEIKDGIHICATKNMAEGIKERYRNDETGEFQYIFTMHQVISRVFSHWYLPEQMMQQYLSLSRCISKSSGEQHLKDAFRNNSTELLDTIRFLIFCGVEPKHLNNLKESMNEHGEPLLTNKERFFVEIWCEVHDDFKSHLVGVRRPEKILEKLNDILKSRSNKNDDKLLVIANSNKKIILHGFYFITPEQQVFMKLLEKAGFDLVFFQYYDNRFPTTFDFSRDFISQRYGWTDRWNIQKNEKTKQTIGASFLQSFEEGKQKQHKVNKSVLAYESFFDFLHSVIMKHYPLGEAKSNEEVQIIATNADILNDLLVQYYPEKFADRRNFLNYPVGQFILKIHEMLQGKRLILNQEILMASFSSGWLTDKHTHENARDYTYELEQLFPFFSDCIDIEEWISRIKDLIDQYEYILPLFESEKDNRVIESIRSPFSKIAHLSLDIVRVKQVQSFFYLLKNIAEDLFDLSNDEISITEHFNRLSDLLKEHNPISNKVLLQKEEEELIEKINYKISSVEQESQFMYEDIGAAIQFYLSGSFSKEEETFIKPFIEVDGEAFKESRNVYLTGLDEQGLPLSEFSIPWPLQEETYLRLSEEEIELELNILRNKSVKKISRYLLFITFEFLWNENLELSWLRNFLDRENLEPAVYVQYLNMKIENHSLQMDVEKETPYNQFDFTSIEPEEDMLQESFEELKYEDILAEYKLCPRRFYYGYVLDRYPTFSDEFIYQFFYSEIVKVVKKYTRQDDETVIKMVSDLFPQWTTFQKENMATNSLGWVRSYWDKRDQITGDVSVSTTRRNFQFPGFKTKDRNEIYEEVGINKEKLMKDIQEPEPVFSNMMEAKPDYHCRFCPFLDLCPEGQYSIDGKGKN